MKNNPTTLRVIVLSALILVAVATAPSMADEGEEQAIRSLLLERFDTDNDGKLDLNERQAAQQRLRRLLEARTLEIKDIQDPAIARLLEVFDRDSDGQLNAEEQKRFRIVVHRLLNGRRRRSQGDGRRNTQTGKPNSNGPSAQQRPGQSGSLAEGRRQAARRDVQQERRRGEWNGNDSSNVTGTGRRSSAGRSSGSDSGSDSSSPPSAGAG